MNDDKSPDLNRNECTVTWMADAQRGLDATLRQQIDSDLRQTFAVETPDSIVVKQRFRGFSDEPMRKLILAVEVQGGESGHSAVVKIGPGDRARSDFSGWNSCAARRGITSRMYIAPILRKLSGNRAAIIYPDVYQYYFNNGRDDEPKELESIVESCIRTAYPSVESVDRVLVQVYSEGFRCFYRDAVEDTQKKSILDAILPSLRFHNSDPVLERWNTSEFLSLRRNAAWLADVRRSPGSLDRPDYIDPVDYARWVLASCGLFGNSGQGDRIPLSTHSIPSMLIGPAHGDLHGRNIIVGVVRGEAEWPAVFDFDTMAPDNLVAWDFGKLEHELKCRLFPQLVETAEDRRLIQSQLRMTPREPLPASVPLTEDDHRIQNDVERMEIMFEIEKVLRSWTRQISSRSQAIRADAQFSPVISEKTPLGRALRIIFRIRREAALSLGFERQGRETVWQDEYYFGLMVYGVVVAKWHSASEHMMWSLMSAGVAAASLTQVPWPPDPGKHPLSAKHTATLTTLPDSSDGQFSNHEDHFDFGMIASYQQLLPWFHQCWKQKQWQESAAVLDAALQRFPYAVALRQQLALLLALSDNRESLERASRLIEPLMSQACLFRDHETLSRLGRIYKDRGDSAYDGTSTLAEIIQKRLPTFQHYQSSLKFYRTAFEVSGDYYPGINAATLALLCGDAKLQQSLAEKILVICGGLPTDRADRIWILASEGEAMLLLHRPEEAASFYAEAVSLIPADESGIRQSIHNQLCRLYWALGSQRVQPVVERLRGIGWFSNPVPGPFGNCQT